MLILQKFGHSFGKILVPSEPYNWIDQNRNWYFHFQLNRKKPEPNILSNSEPEPENSRTDPALVATLFLSATTFLPLFWKGSMKGESYFTEKERKCKENLDTKFFTKMVLKITRNHWILSPPLFIWFSYLTSSYFSPRMFEVLAFIPKY